MKKLKNPWCPLISKLFACPVTLQQSSEEHGWKISPTPQLRKSTKKASPPSRWNNADGGDLEMPPEASDSHISFTEWFEASNDDRIRF